MAGLLVAIDPFLILLSSLLLTETLFITALVALWLAGWDLQHRSRGAGLGRWGCVVGSWSRRFMNGWLLRSWKWEGMIGVRSRLRVRHVGVADRPRRKFAMTMRSVTSAAR